MAELLRGHGYRVTEADSVEKALQHLREERPDLVVLDVQLPPAGGVELLREAARAGLPPLRTVVLLPSMGDESDWRRLEEFAGAAFVTRSAPIDDILVATRAVLFPESKDLRRSPRAQARVPLTYRIEPDDGAAGSEISTYTFNLSADGMFAVTSSEEPAPPGSRVRLTFWVPGAQELLNAEGVVIWCNRAGGRMNELYPPGMGIMFYGLTREATEAIAEFVRQSSRGPLP